MRRICDERQQMLNAYTHRFRTLHKILRRAVSAEPGYGNEEDARTRFLY